MMIRELAADELDTLLLGTGHAFERLDDGRVAIHCKCGTSIAITCQHEGRSRLRIKLRGSQRSEAAKAFIDTGGRCPRCGVVQQISLPQVARALGYASFAAWMRDEGFASLIGMWQKMEAAARAELKLPPRQTGKPTAQERALFWYGIGLNAGGHVPSSEQLQALGLRTSDFDSALGAHWWECARRRLVR